ncbi:MAG TPA: histidinol dehydrogenase [Solirubrobacteraceae bacterium]
MASEWSAQTIAAELRSAVPSPESVAGSVAEIIERVARDGDAGVARFTQEFDTAGEPAPPLWVDVGELEQAEQAVDPAIASAVRTAYQNVYGAARAGLTQSRTVAEDADRQIILREEPVRRAAVYVPGGRAPYPSTVVMGVAAARAANVRDIVVCSPPPIDSVILAACQLTGVDEVHRMGGAQAIAALAYGTESIRGVDVIVGPGNIYVQEAKRQVSAVVGIDAFAGPSDLLVIVEDDVEDLEPVALDLLAQAEHGPGTLVVAVSTSQDVLDRLAGRVETARETAAVTRLIRAPTIEDALALAEAFAPEHLQLVGADAEALAPMVTRAGCLFVGEKSGTAFGDYIVGSNHVLPTSGSARFASGLTTVQFRRRFAEVRVRRVDALARAAAPLAQAEGFKFHAQSMTARIRDNRSE